MVTDYKRALQVINLLHLYFLDNDCDIANVEFPSNINYASEEWLYYVFYSCLLDYGMKSKIYHNNMIRTYSSYPEIFNPHYVIKCDKDILLKIMKENIHPRYPNVALNKWFNLSNELTKYDNLMDVVKSFQTFQDLRNFIQDMSGYGQKTGGLLLRLIYEADICSFDEITCIPLDRHDIEISYLTGIITKKELSAKEIESLCDIFIQVSKELKIKANIIDKYLWEIGSRFCNKKDCLNCPLKITCKSKI